MDAASYGRFGGALRRRLDTGKCQREREAVVATYRDFADHRVPDKFYSALRGARIEEQMETPQRHDEPHGSATSGFVGEDHSKLPPG